MEYVSVYPIENAHGFACISLCYDITSLCWAFMSMICVTYAYFQGCNTGTVDGMIAPVAVRLFWKLKVKYRRTSNIRRTTVGNKIVDHSDEVGASPVGAAPTTSSFST